MCIPSGLSKQDLGRVESLTSNNKWLQCTLPANCLIYKKLQQEEAKGSYKREKSGPCRPKHDDIKIPFMAAMLISNACCSLPYIDGTQGFLAQMQQSAQVKSVQIPNTRPHSSVTAAYSTSYSTSYNTSAAKHGMHRRAQ